MERRDFIKLMILLSSTTYLGFFSGCSVTDETEKIIKDRLNIPSDAKQILFLSQSSHWDINWQKTFKEYYDENVRKIIDDSLVHLDINKNNHYSISEIAFLRYFWDNFPEKRDIIKNFYEENRLQIVGGGITSPDTMLPTMEMLMRDWILGNRWVKENLGGFADTAWQPDSFGHSGTLPDVLDSIGYKYVGFSRIDGAPFFTSTEIKSIMGKIGGGSEYLEDSHGKYMKDNELSLFWWEGAGGAKVLAYWMPYTYCQGDFVDSSIPVSLPGAILSSPDNKELVFKRITQFIDDLKLFSKNRKYLFVPVGCDFQSPHIKLADYCDWWNNERYKDTGIYTVPGTFRDFMILSEKNEKEIPIIKGDLNPLWTGFYSMHPYLKEASTEITRYLIQGEMLAALSSDWKIYEDFNNLWEKSVRINHHDWIPGTSMDHVYYDEQLPDSKKWVKDSILLWEKSLFNLISDMSLKEGEKLIISIFNPFPFDYIWSFELSAEFEDKFTDLSYQDVNSTISVRKRELYNSGNIKTGLIFGTIKLKAGSLNFFELSEKTVSNKNFVSFNDNGNSYSVKTDFYDFTVDKSTGNINELKFKEEVIATNFNIFRIYNDDGGLYRMGMEMSCGNYVEKQCNLNSTSIEIIDLQPIKWGIKFSAVYDKFTVEKVFWLYPYSPVIDFETDIQPIGNFPDHIAWVMGFETNYSGDKFDSHLPGGMINRNRKGLYKPTYWPLEGWLKVDDNKENTGIFSAKGNRGWRIEKDGLVEMVALRSATLEKCANLGAWGIEKDGYKSTYSFYPSSKPESSEIIRYGFKYNFSPVAKLLNLDSNPDSVTVFTSDSDDVLISSLYSSVIIGKGLILRLYNPLLLNKDISITLNINKTFQVYQVNGKEEILAKLGIMDKIIKVRIEKPIESFFLEEI